MLSGVGNRVNHEIEKRNEIVKEHIFKINELTHPDKLPLELRKPSINPAKAEKQKEAARQKIRAGLMNCKSEDELNALWQAFDADKLYSDNDKNNIHLAFYGYQSQSEPIKDVHSSLSTKRSKRQLFIHAKIGGYLEWIRSNNHSVKLKQMELPIAAQSDTDAAIAYYAQMTEPQQFNPVFIQEGELDQPIANSMQQVFLETLCDRFKQSGDALNNEIKHYYEVENNIDVLNQLILMSMLNSSDFNDLHLPFALLFNDPQDQEAFKMLCRRVQVKNASTSPIKLSPRHSKIEEVKSTEDDLHQESLEVLAARLSQQLKEKVSQHEFGRLWMLASREALTKERKNQERILKTLTDKFHGEPAEESIGNSATMAAVMVSQDPENPKRAALTLCSAGDIEAYVVYINNDTNKIVSVSLVKSQLNKAVTVKIGENVLLPWHGRAILIMGPKGLRAFKSSDKALFNQLLNDNHEASDQVFNEKVAEFIVQQEVHVEENDALHESKSNAAVSTEITAEKIKYPAVYVMTLAKAESKSEAEAERTVTFPAKKGTWLTFSQGIGKDYPQSVSRFAPQISSDTMGELDDCLIKINNHKNNNPLKTPLSIGAELERLWQQVEPEAERFQRREAVIKMTQVLSHLVAENKSISVAEGQEEAFQNVLKAAKEADDDTTEAFVACGNILDDVVTQLFNDNVPRTLIDDISALEAKEVSEIKNAGQQLNLAWEGICKVTPDSWRNYVMAQQYQSLLERIVQAVKLLPEEERQNGDEFKKAPISNLQKNQTIIEEYVEGLKQARALEQQLAKECSDTFKSVHQSVKQALDGLAGEAFLAKVENEFAKKPPFCMDTYPQKYSDQFIPPLLNAWDEAYELGKAGGQALQAAKQRREAIVQLSEALVCLYYDPQEGQFKIMYGQLEKYKNILQAARGAEKASQSDQDLLPELTHMLAIETISDFNEELKKSNINRNYNISPGFYQRLTDMFYQTNVYKSHALNLSPTWDSYLKVVALRKAACKMAEVLQYIEPVSRHSLVLDEEEEESQSSTYRIKAGCGPQVAKALTEARQAEQLAGVSLEFFPELNDCLNDYEDEHHPAKAQIAGLFQNNIAPKFKAIGKLLETDWRVAKTKGCGSWHNYQAASALRAAIQKVTDAAKLLRIEDNDVSSTLLSSSHALPREASDQSFAQLPIGSLSVASKAQADQYKKLLQEAREAEKALSNYRGIFPRLHLATVIEVLVQAPVKILSGGYYTMRYGWLWDRALTDRQAVMRHAIAGLEEHVGITSDLMNEAAYQEEYTQVQNNLRELKISPDVNMQALGRQLEENLIATRAIGKGSEAQLAIAEELREAVTKTIEATVYFDVTIAQPVPHPSSPGAAELKSNNPGSALAEPPAKIEYDPDDRENIEEAALQVREAGEKLKKYNGWIFKSPAAMKHEQALRHLDAVKSRATPKVGG